MTTSESTADHLLSPEEVFQPIAFTNAWRNFVRDKFQEQYCRDLIDYYDYSLAIAQHGSRLRAQLLAGSYRTSLPLEIELGKSDGLVRRTQIPAPDDAVVLQVISNALYVRAKPIQSRNVFFSQSRATPTGIHSESVPVAYPWNKLWEYFQKKILNFAAKKPVIVVTDIQNYFDSIKFDTIRRALIREVQAPQEIIDLTLFLLENYLKRHPAYSPISERGLAQLNFDAPRVLANVILYPLDRYLEKTTGDCFSRWADDITFGTDSKRVARQMIRNIERNLQEVDMRLNGSKTKILDETELRRYLQADENLKITAYQICVKKGLATKSDFEHFILDFLRYRTVPPYGHWDKVVRRYYNLLGRVIELNPGYLSKLKGKKKLFEACQADFEHHMDFEIRRSIVRFWRNLPITRELLHSLVEHLTTVSKYDDVISFDIARSLVERALTKDQVRFLLSALGDVHLTMPGGFTGVAHIYAKYGSAEDILGFIQKNETYWATNDFLCRQVVCLWAVLPTSDDSSALLQRLTKEQFRSFNTLFEFFLRLRATKTFDSGMRRYLTTSQVRRQFDLPRAIIARNVLQSDFLQKADRAFVESEIMGGVTDPALRRIALGKLR